MSRSACTVAPLLLATAAAAVGVATAAPANAKPYHHSTISSKTSGPTTASTSVQRYTPAFSVNRFVDPTSPAAEDRSYDRVVSRYFHPITTPGPMNTSGAVTAGSSEVVGASPGHSAVISASPPATLP
jgi:hypothetical protein